MRSFVRAVALAIVVGLALGAAGQMGPDLHPALRWVVALGVPWLVTATVAGALVGDPARGALAGAVALVVGTLVYYAIHFGLGSDGIRSIPLRGAPIVVGWCAAAAGGGALFGLLGALWRRGGPVATVTGTALVSGALVGEALLLLQEWSARGAGAQLVLTAELAAGAVLPFLLIGRRPRLLAPALVLTVAMAAAVALTEDSVRDALRIVGWRGA